MKKTNKVTPILLTLMMGMISVAPLAGCNLGTGSDNSSGAEQGATVNTISASLLDGKVANLMSANGIAIQDKTESVSAVSATKSNVGQSVIVAHADESSIEQPKTELVKETEDGVQDVHFYDGAKGDYTEWNDAYTVHHHDGVACEVENCIEISDEILQEEAQAPTIVSLESRVNKLYNTGKFTFLCVSSAVEGEVKLITEKTITPISITQRFFIENGAYLNVEGHYFSEDDHSYAVSYIEVKSGEKSGKILVQRSAAEEGYHYSNYWSNDFNQSYLIDNETGKAYSLSALPYIYSVRNGAILVKDNSLKIYQPKIVNDQLVLDELAISDKLSQKYGTGEPIIDIYGNVLFTGYSNLPGADEYGEVREEGFIFAGTSQEVIQRIQQTTSKQFADMKVRSYMQAKRYLRGSDGRIYRFDFRGETQSIPVHVLNEQGQWTNVPDTAHVVFSGKDCWFTELSIHAATQQYLLITQIKGGKSYFVNAALGSDWRWTKNTMAIQYGQAGHFVGVSALPTDGSADTGMQEFMQNVSSTDALDDKSIVYRVGATAFAYENKATNELIIWDRETETRQSIAVGQVTLSANSHLMFTEYDFISTCFQASTANGMYYVSYDEKNPTKAWNEYSTTPIARVEKLSAYYQLLLENVGR